MKELLRPFLPQILINYFWHLPNAVLANILYGFPSRKLKVIGVTGTDGKTTTVNMIFQILKKAGKKVSMVSTINAEVAGRVYDTGFHVTSPDSFTIQKFLSQAVENKDEFMVLEVTSHALDQFRFFGVSFKVGVITNITHEHLDYHKTFENYSNTKAKLIQNAKYRILNRGEDHFGRLLKIGSGKLVTFGLSEKADFNPKSFPVNLMLPGQFNVLNGLAAAAATTSLGIDPEKIKQTLSSFENLEGRMQSVPNSLGINIVIDFAHTPNALENALKALRKETQGKLISVFGAAGERDIQKRPMMGEISSKLADITILTDEDPRYEDSQKIIEEIANGASSNKKLYKESDRMETIKLAISLAKPGDTIGIFGKGHEKSMNYKGKELPWSDFEAAQKALSQR